jgi:c-di-GMP-binding flagellar brake protein YcgR
MGMSNRRRFERIQFFREVSLTVLPDGPTVAAHTFDISLGGVGLSTQTSLEPGKMVAISFPVRDRSHKTIVNRVIGKVVRLQADPDGNRVGVEFIETLSPSVSCELFNQVSKL